MSRLLTPHLLSSPYLHVIVFLGLVIVASRMIGDAFGAGGALLGAVGLGLADVDSVTVASRIFFFSILAHSFNTQPEAVVPSLPPPQGL